MLPRPRLFAAVLAVALLGPVARAAEEDGAPPPAPAPEPPVEALPEVVVRPPRAFAGPRAETPEASVTPLRREAATLDVPAAISVVEWRDIVRRRMSRSLPDALLQLPGVMVQKTAPLQSSPFVRGFTGYQNLALIDGIRFNHAGMRAGPNQYWSTIDPYTVERIELVRGPQSVLYGTDAVGGALNVIPRRRASFCPGFHLGGQFSTRYASAERAFFQRVGLEGNAGRVGWLGGVTYKSYGDIQSGDGRLWRTGGITEWDGDLRLDVALARAWNLVLAWQHVGQRDAPRTHNTIFSVPFAGTTAGNELRRDYDQRRDLAYTRIEFDGRQGPVSRAHLGVSWQRQWEQRDRLRTGNRSDLEGFELHQVGVQLQVVTPTRIGRLTWGVDFYHDMADTWRRDYLMGVLASTSIQGPFGDDGRYDLLGVYLQDEVSFGRVDLIGGVRFTYARAAVDRVDNPAVAGSDPATPGNVIAVSNDWTNVVGSFQVLYHLRPSWTAYASVAQAFRTPTLHDLTSLETTSVVETPAPGLGPEKYLTFELGTKTATPRFAGSAAVYTTLLDDAIIRSPTGAMVGGVPEVRKDNIGDGWLWGVEVEGAWRATSAVTLFGNLSTNRGRADELDPATGMRVRSPITRLLPLTGTFGARYEPTRSRFWVQGEVTVAARQNRLSLRDMTDGQRIPPGGTPAWQVVNLRAGVKLGRGTNLTVALENLLDENYRIHGSGVNEPGRSLVAALDVEM